MRLASAVLLTSIVVPLQLALADDSAANYLVKSYADVCIPNAGESARVRDWAVDNHLVEITNQAALSIFVGTGGKGAAWYMPSTLGSFALSVRGASEACAVWARAANPADVEAYFMKIVQGAARPGIAVTVVKDTHDGSPVGVVHTLIYSVSPGGKPNEGFLYTMQVSEKSGGPFQASLQVARYHSF